MRRLFAILTVVTLLAFSAVFFALPVSADASTQKCYQYAVSVNNPTTNSGSADIELHDFNPQTASYQMSYTVQPGETRTISVQGLFPKNAGSFAGSESGTNVNYISLVTFGVVDFSVCAGFGKIGDGRINDGADQEGAPLAAYCTNADGIAVWDIDDTGHGTLAFTSTSADIDKALSDAQSSGQNVLVGQGLGDSLYALSTNQLTLVGPDVKESGKTYQFIMTSTPCA